MYHEQILQDEECVGKDCQRVEKVTRFVQCHNVCNIDLENTDTICPVSLSKIAVEKWPFPTVSTKC